MSEKPAGFYDVGKGRGSGFDVMSRIEALKETAVVMDHDTNKMEIWWKGQCRGAWEVGTVNPSDIFDTLREEDRRLGR
jgi:hypothetical protein